MTAQVIDLGVARKMRALIDDGTVVPLASHRDAAARGLDSSAASRVGEAMAPAWPVPEEIASHVGIDQARGAGDMTSLTVYRMVDGRPVVRCILKVGQQVRRRAWGVSGEYLGTIWRFQTRPGMPGSAANVIVTTGYRTKFFSPEEIEPIPGDAVDPEPAA